MAQLKEKPRGKPREKPKERFKEKLDSLPSSPGVYLFRGAEDEVLYVGKARSLRSRVRSYFQPGTSDSRYFIELLEHELEDIETFVAGTEKEAALLENQLIKEHRPRFNVKLRDDKEYLSLRLNTRASWPRLEVVRRPKPDGAKYFGPYHSATAGRQTLRSVNRFFRLRTCTDSEFKGRARPCLQYQIKRCLGPCVLPVDKGEYADQVESVALFLDGKHDQLVDNLSGKMQSAADMQAYELAAMYRDQIQSIASVQQAQRVTVVKDIDQDVIGLFRQADQAEVAVLRIRSGKLIGVRTFDLRGVRTPNDEILAGFLSEYYSPGVTIPDEILLPLEIEAVLGFEAVLTERRGKRARVLVPQRAAKAKLISMANENASHAFNEKARAREDIEKRLGELQKKLRLPEIPRRIECIDISHSQGDDAVAAIVAMKDGAPDRKRYRSFNLRRTEKGDDYGAMYEALSRRFRRGREAEKGWELPNLMVVDGGKGQLNAALRVLADLEMTGMPVVALAKEKENAYGELLVDRVYSPGQKNPIALRESSAALQVLALARDEAHRASNHHRKKRGKKRQFRSELDGIPGVGPKTRTALLTNLGSLENVRKASLKELQTAGANTSQATAILRALGVPAKPKTPPDSEPSDSPKDDVGEEEAVENAFRN